MVSAWDTPSAAIVVGLMLLTPGTGTTAVTANACDPEQSAAVVALTERHTRTYIVPATVPGFMVIVTWLPLLIVGALLKLIHTPPVPFHCHCPMLLLGSCCHRWSARGTRHRPPLSLG